jgi:hypothetical protein
MLLQITPAIVISVQAAYGVAGVGVGSAVCALLRKVNITSIDVVPDKVMSDLNVLRLVVLNRIMSNLDGTLIVTQEWNLVTMNSIVLQCLPHPKELSTTTHGRHILGFGGGERHTVLLLRRPTN